MVPFSAAKSLFAMVAMFVVTHLLRRSPEIPEVVTPEPPIDLVQWAKEWVAQHHGVSIQTVESTYPLTICDRLKFWEDAATYFELDSCLFEDISGGYLCIDVTCLYQILRAKGKKVCSVTEW